VVSLLCPSDHALLHMVEMYRQTLAPTQTQRLRETGSTGPCGQPTGSCVDVEAGASIQQVSIA
jgi:hypothetical protein